MKYKTYKKKPTKYFKKYYNKIKATFILLFFLVAGIDMLFSLNQEKEIEQISEQVSQIEEKVNALENVEMIKLISNNYQQEIEVRQAVKQACEYINAEQWGLQEQCEKDLLGIAYVETQKDPFNCQLVGDLNFKGSYGCFQINKHYHPEITKEQAEDPYWASIWTAKRLVAKGYPVYRSNAIRSHNGGITNPATKTYLDKVNQIALK